MSDERKAGVNEAAGSRHNCFVGGVRCVLRSPESSGYIEQVCRVADQMMQQVRRENAAMRTEKVAILALINASDRMLVAERALAELRRRDRVNDRSADRLQGRLAEARRINQRLLAAISDYDARSALLEAALALSPAPAAAERPARRAEASAAADGAQLSFDDYRPDGSYVLLEDAP